MFELKSTLMIPQRRLVEIRELKQEVDGLIRFLKDQRRLIRDDLDNGAVVEPGLLSAHIQEGTRTSATWRFLEQVVGSEQYKWLREHAPKHTHRYVRIIELTRS
jgi:hypothetical protein